MTVVQLLATLGALGIRLHVEGDELRYDRPATQPLDADLADELRRSKPEIMDLLRSTRLADDRPPVTPAPPGTRAPASFAQRRFFYVDQLAGPSASYNLPSAFRIRGLLDVDALTQSLDDICGRHEILRTRLVAEADSLWQVPRSPDSGCPLQVVDLSRAEGIAKEELERLIRREADRPFDLAEGPHARAIVVKLASDDHALLLYLHHIVSDDASIAIFVNELRTLYRAHTRQAPAAALPPVPIQYPDFACWQSTWLTGAILDVQLEFWRRHLAGAPPMTELPFDRPRSATSSPDGAEIAFMIAPELLDSIDALRFESGCTRFQVLFTALAILLRVYSRQRTLVIGTSNSIRPQWMASAIGPFVNLLPVRIDTCGDLTIKTLLRQVRKVSVDALAHGDAPFESIVEAVRPPRSASCSPLFNVLFVLEDVLFGIFDLPGLDVSTLEVSARAVKYDLTLALQRTPGGMVGRFKFRTDLFDASTVERMTGHYRTVLTAMVHHSECELSNVSILTAQERTSLAAARGRAATYDFEHCTHTRFEEQAAASPEAIALEVEHEGLTLTRGELNAQANRLARLLRGAGVGPESTVGIALERSTAMIVAVLGVLKAGAQYVPIVPELPLARQQLIVSDAGISVLLSEARLLASGPRVATQINLDDPETIRRLAAEAAFDLPNLAGPASPCVTIFTSGTTGNPKGIVLEHRALCNNLLWMQEQWPLSETDAVLLKAPFGFDVSFKEMLWPLMTGARLVVTRPGGHRDPVYLHDLIARRGVTVTHLVPSMLEYFLERHDAAAPTPLRLVMCGGEALTPGLKERFCSVHPAGLLHLYGPTETAIAVTGVLLERGDGRTSIPLGEPPPNVAIHLVDADFNEVPVGVVGELCVGGVALARGYLNAPGLTAEKFVPDPFSGRAGARLYRTGDLAKRRANGDLEFLGRVDDQVKLRGLRIELGEIERALEEYPGVRDCLVRVWENPSSASRLVAYVVGTVDVATHRTTMLEALRQRLPSYMIPAEIVAIAAIPVGVNGKADRTALPPPSRGGTTSEGVEAPSGDVETRLLTLWEEVLQREGIGRNENFFDAGGHSLLVLRLQKRVNETFSRRFAVSDFFLYPTVAEMAKELVRGEGAAVKLEPQARPMSSNADEDRSIAIVGLALRLPGADDANEYWENLCRSVDSITTFSTEELLADGVPRALLQRPNYVRARGYVAGLDQFDHEAFGFTSAEAQLLDPQHRLLLECAQRALDDAGYDPTSLQLRTGAVIGAYVGVGRSSYYLNNLQTRPELLETFGPLQLAMATDRSYAATQLAYRLNLNGPSVSFDTACSTSLVAIHHACKALIHREADLLLAGGSSVDVPLKSGYIHVDGQVGSPDGRCRPFDARASGTVKASGGAIIVLKRLRDAIADGDFVYAVIRGSAINNDGAARVGFTAPSVAGQASVVSRALADAGLSPTDSIDYIETHGTGTALGDPIEIAALAQVFTSGRIAIGSVKGNIGHLDVASGVAGLIKVALSLRHGRILPSIHFERPNPHIDFSSTPFHVNTELRDWIRPAARPRRASVSSFGIGGTNAHVVLEEAPAGPAGAVACRPEVLRVALPRRVFKLSRHWITPAAMAEEPLGDEPSQPLECRHARTSTNDALARLWQVLLGVDHPPGDMNFFEAGGDSLLATQLAARIQNVLDVRLTPAQIYEHPTFAALSQLVDALGHVHAGIAGSRSRDWAPRVELEV